MTEMGVFETMYSARALRRLKPDPIPDEVIAKILDAAIRAPSANNEQHWVFMVVTDPEQRRRVGEVYRRIGDGMLPVVQQLYETPGAVDVNDPTIKKLNDSVRYLYEHLGDAPLLIVPCLRPNTTYWEGAKVADDILQGMMSMDRFTPSSIYPAVQNIILACRALGLGTVMTTLHGVKEAEIKAILGIPDEVTTWALLPIGYPLGKFGPVKRKPIEEVAYRDRWGVPWGS